MQSLLILLLLSTNSVYGPTVDPLRASVTNQDQRAFIKCHVLLGTPASEVCRMLATIARSNAYSERQVYRLYNEFKECKRLSCEDATHEGRPCSSTDEEHEERLRELLNEDKNWSTDELTLSLGISKSSTLRLLNKIEAQKVASRWVPYNLTLEQKQMRVNISTEHLIRFRSDPDMLDRIIAIDETWIRSYDPKDPQSSREWRLPGQKP